VGPGGGGGGSTDFESPLGRMVSEDGLELHHGSFSLLGAVARGLEGGG
jgi:hypothetical protein